MTDKAYIVANEQQEQEVLEKLEEKEALWGTGKNATDFISFRTFPYVIYCNGNKYISWDKLGDLDVDKIIVFDGRKEERPISVDSFENSIDTNELIEILKGFDLIKEKNMSEKYVVSQEFMNELERWKDTLDSNDYVSIRKLNALPVKINNWRWCHDNKEKNNRLIAIIRWVNGEDVFEVEKPKKWIVRSKEHNNFGEYTYVTTDDIFSLAIIMGVKNATKFDTKEEAESWANSHQEVVEVEE